jgi:hypothetical protein
MSFVLDLLIHLLWFYAESTMLWKPINFQGVIVIDKELVEQLQCYLEEKRTNLGSDIIRAFQLTDWSDNPPLSLT